MEGTRCGSRAEVANAGRPVSPPRSSFGRCMRIWPLRNGLGGGVLSIVVLTGCSAESTPSESPAPAAPTKPAAPAPASGKLVIALVDVPADLAQSPLDEPR